MTNESWQMHIIRKGEEVAEQGEFCGGAAGTIRFGPNAIAKPHAE